MNWWGWALTVAGVGSFVIAWRRVFRSWVDDFSPMDWDDLALGIVMASMFAACCFPLIALYVVFESATGRANADPNVWARRMAGESRKDKLRRREREVRDRERRIEQMERDLGVGPFANRGEET